MKQKNDPSQLVWKKLKPAIVILPLFTATLLTAQGIYFFTLLSNRQPPPQTADLIVVFRGRGSRVEAAYSLIEKTGARLLISPATIRQLNAYDRLYGAGRPIHKLIETKARTTFENALFTGQIMKASGLKSAVLVTSWDHMARSYLMFKMQLGSDTAIYLHPVATGRLNAANWHRHTMGWKMAYNEMIECWGSLIELAGYTFNGRLSPTAPGKTRTLAGLKKWLLFEIDPDALNTGS